MEVVAERGEVPSAVPGPSRGLLPQGLAALLPLMLSPKVVSEVSEPLAG